MNYGRLTFRWSSGQRTFFYSFAASHFCMPAVSVCERVRLCVRVCAYSAQDCASDFTTVGCCSKPYVAADGQRTGSSDLGSYRVHFSIRSYIILHFRHDWDVRAQYSGHVFFSFRFRRLLVSRLYMKYRRKGHSILYLSVFKRITNVTRKPRWSDDNSVAYSDFVFHENRLFSIRDFFRSFIFNLVNKNDPEPSSSLNVPASECYWS
jgi:hypothetical protein